MSSCSVGLLLSSEHSSPKSFIGIFKAGAAFSFEGCVQIQILAGALDIEGYLATPSKKFYTVYSPLTNARSVISSFTASSKLNDSRVKEYIKSLLCREKSNFVDRSFSATTQTETSMHNYVILDVNYEDAKQLNDILNSKHWQHVDITAIVVIRETSTTVLQALVSHHLTMSSFESILHMSSFCQMRNLKIINTFKNCLIIPESYRQIVLDIVTVNKPIILVCGNKNSGKSTCCRILTNLLLNTYSTVAFLECDVGQCEFTVSGIISLQFITEPLFGPSFVHLRNPDKSYVFGDTSPKCQPDFYIHLIDICMKHYHEATANESIIPLVVNTCGWTTGLGISLLMDLIRIVSPTHIIQFNNHKDCHDHSELPPLTLEFIKSNFGWSFVTNQVPQPQQLVSDIGLFSSNNLELLKKLRQHGANSPILISSANDERSSDSGEDEEDEDTFAFSGRKRLHKDTSSSNKKGRYDELTSNGAVVNREWLTDLKCKLFLLSSFKCAKNSQTLRKTSIVAHFSPLLDSLSHSLRTKASFNFIMAATPYEIPWDTIAIHSIHKKVPSNQLLYAINGNFVSLSHVKQDEIINYSDSFRDIKIIKSVHPEAEFIGLGLVRGINPDSKLMYITTPLSPHQLESVNCLILGNWERSLELLLQQHISSSSPYILQHFRHYNYGRLGWNE